MFDEKTKEKIRNLHVDHGVPVSALMERFSAGGALIRSALGIQRPRRASGSETASQAFEKLQAAALAGERCPMNHALPGGGTSVSSLARQGKIFVEVYLLNFRRVTIMEGAHNGKKTAPAPDHRGRPQTPYLTVGMEGKRYHGGASRQMEKAAHG